MPELERCVRELEAAQILLLDLSKLRSLDSTGLRTIIKLHDRALAEGWTLRLLHGPPEVRRVFKLTRTEYWLPFV